MSYLDDLLEKRMREKDEADPDLASRSPNEQYVWWLACDEKDPDGYISRQRAGSLLSSAKDLESAQQEIHEQNLWSAQLYSNRQLASFDWGNGALVRASLSPVSRSHENIIVRLVDTLVSQIGKNRPKPKPVARGASFTVRQSVKKLDKFLYGEFQRNHLYALTKQVFRDACIFGFGCIKTSMEEDPRHGARVKYERVFPDEVLVDQMEIVATGKIRHFYRRRVLPIEVVAATYDVSEAELRRQSTQGFTYLENRPIGAGWIPVIEGYQAAHAGAPGRWMVATPTMVLDEGEWEHEWLPYSFYHWQTPVSGFYASSVVEQCLPYQIRLNEINEIIRDAQDLMGRPRIFVAEGSRVNPMELDNAVGRIIKYTGIKPEAITWNAVSAELYNERERLVAQCLEQFGISNLASTVTPPPGARFDSSPAFREFNAIQDDRLSDPSQRFEEFHLELAQRTIDVISASGENPKTVWYSGWKDSKAEELDWKDVAADAESYVMTMEATSLFNMSPASARDELEKQLGMGLITPEQYRLELSDMDQEGAYTLAAAAAQDLNRVQELLEAGEFETPTKEQDLVNGVTQMTLALLNLRKYKDVPEQTELNFVNWITLAQAILEQGSQPTDATEMDADEAMMGPDPLMPGSTADLGGMGMAGDPAAMGGMPQNVPVPEAMGLAPAGPGPMPNV
jgi:hypothetical protein